MWTVAVEAPVDQVYEALKERFDEKYVPRYEVAWEDSRVGRKHTKEQHLPEADGGLDSRTSLQFRLALKSVQAQLPEYTGKVKVTLKGDETSMSTKVEVV